MMVLKLATLFAMFLMVPQLSSIAGEGDPAADIKVSQAGDPALRTSTARFVADQPVHVAVDYGEEIAFIYNNDLWVQKADGTGRRSLLTKGTEYMAIGSPAWSLDGKKIAFATILKNDLRVVDLFVANADGSGAQPILRLNAGYYSSSISSISWSGDNQYIMFVYGYNAQDWTTLLTVCTVTKTGSNFSLGPRNDVPGAQYEPTSGASRYAYTTLGTILNYNSDLFVSNMNGTSVVNWYRLTDVDCYGDLVWLTSTSICAVARKITGYPNKELLIRFDRPGTTTSTAILVQSDVNAKLTSPSFGPTRRKLYMCETVNNTPTLWYSEWNASWVNTVNAARGYGNSPNWRQVIPVPDQPVLLSPANNAVGVATRPTLTWQTAAGALSYRLRVTVTAGGAVAYDQSGISGTSAQVGPLAAGTQFSWTVTPHNNAGDGPVSSAYRFTTGYTDVRNDGTIPDRYALEQNYPNPFNPSTTIKYELPRAAHVTLCVIDALGREVSVLVNEGIEAGSHEVQFDADGLAGGIYLYRLRAGDFASTKKMLVLK